MKNDTIFHIKTGGTISGCVPEYKEIEIVSSVFDDIVNYVKYIKNAFKLENNYVEYTVCHKDSRDVNDEDRDKIISEIKKQFNDGVRKFLITHGTFTMPDTGKYLINNFSEEILNSSLIIITGSMFPWLIHGSDAPMNLGAALSNLVNQDVNGVFICMHGKRFHPDNIFKDKDNLIFKTNN